MTVGVENHYENAYPSTMPEPELEQRKQAYEATLIQADRARMRGLCRTIYEDGCAMCFCQMPYGHDGPHRATCGAEWGFRPDERYFPLPGEPEEDEA